MSEAAAKLLHVAGDDLTRYLIYSEEDDVGGQVLSEPATLSDTVVSVAVTLVVVLVVFVVLAGSVIVYLTNKKRTSPQPQQLAKEGAELACDEDSLYLIAKPSPLIPQSQATRFPLDVAKHQGEVKEQLWKLKVERCDVTAGFLHHYNKLQVKVRRLVFSDFDEILIGNAFSNFMVAVELQNQGAPVFFESPIRPLQNENLYEESFEFDMSLEELTTTALKLSVYVTDRYSQHRMVHQYHYNMSTDADNHVTPGGGDGIIFPVTLTTTLSIDDEEQMAELRAAPQLSFSLCYMPTSGRLTVVMLKGRNISTSPGKRADSSLDIFLQLTLLLDGEMRNTVEGETKKSPHPVFNESFVFNIPLERIQDTELVVHMFTPDVGGEKKKLGKICTGAKAAEVGRQHWEEMLAVPRRPVAEWHRFVAC